MAKKQTVSRTTKPAGKSATHSTQPKKPPSASSKRFAISENINSPSLKASCLRHQMIMEAAYYLAEQRGFTPGYELEDWLSAESEIDTGLNL